VRGLQRTKYVRRDSNLAEASLIEQYDEAISWRKNGSAKEKP